MGVLLVVDLLICDIVMVRGLVVFYDDVDYEFVECYFFDIRVWRVVSVDD